VLKKGVRNGRATPPTKKLSYYEDSYSKKERGKMEAGGQGWEKRWYGFFLFYLGGVIEDWVFGVPGVMKEGDN